MNAPSRIFICVKGREAPDWVVERMTTLEINPDGSFEIEAADGVTLVEPGFAVFEFNDQIFASHPRQVQAKIGKPVAATPPTVAAPERTVSRSDKPLKLKPIMGAPCAPQFCVLDHLLIDDTYQRSIEGGASQTLIRKIAENWDYRLCLPLIVSRRAGRFYVIDGQHRLEGARLRGDIHNLPCIVFDFDDPKAEAELFVAANRSRRSMSKLDDFHAAVAAGDKKCIAVSAAVEAAGLSVGRVAAWQYWKPGEVVFVTAIQRALNKVGRPVVDQALGMIARAFAGCILTGVGAVFVGLVEMIVERGRDGRPFDDTLMESVLREVGIPGWKEAVEGVENGNDRSDTMLKALEAAYTEAEGE